MKPKPAPYGLRVTASAAGLQW